MNDVENETGAPAAEVCPLGRSDQIRNLLLFASCTGLLYLAAPVLYVGITQASLCKHLGADTRVSNLPATLYFAMTAMPALIAWGLPYISYLKRNLAGCYLITSGVLGLTAVVLSTSLPDNVKIGMLIVQGGVSGAVMPAAIAFLWEVIGRGTDESRRGLALSLAFGAGPALAVAGSFAQFALIGGHFLGLEFEGIGYPLGFIVLFGAGVPCMALAATLSTLFVVPLPETEVTRKPFSSVAGLCAAMLLVFVAISSFFVASDPSAAAYELRLRAAGYTLLAIAGAIIAHYFRDILSKRVLLLATVVTILVYSGNTIASNMNLFTEHLLGELPEKYAGVQNAYRFGFKMVAGFFLGWLLSRTHAKAGILVTSGIYIAAQLWAIFVPGKLYLLAFGIYGAGELIGVYAPNYILSASRKIDIRRNMAFVTMLMAPAAPAGYFFGAIVDHLQPEHGPLVAFRASFAVCAAVMLVGMVIALVFLPARPRPE